MKKLYMCVLVLLAAPAFIWAQGDLMHQPGNYQLHIEKTSGKITIDGVLDEPVWKSAEAASNFWLKFPNNNSHARLQTRVQMSYDDQFIYVAATCYDSSRRYLVQSLKRDQGLRTGDGIGIVLDPFGQQTNGFFFAVSAFNSQTEDLLSANNSAIDFSWDNKWYSETKIYDDCWVAEIAIPFNILRYDAQRLIWSLNFIRSNRKDNEFHTWTRIPMQFLNLDLGYMGQLHWPQPPPRSGINYALNPYVAGSVLSDRQNNLPVKASANAGFDAKVAVSPSLNLDLTVNPDFSQVDVDRQVTNLTRFNIFFPERRVFFLENSDLFTAYGIPPVQPFYSRRIGAKNGQNVPILFGARLSGNVSKKTRLGIMNIQTGKKNGEAADNFTALSVNHRVLKRSTVSGYFLNRQGILNEQQKKDDPLARFGRNAGMELEYTSQSGKWNGWYGHHMSMKPDIKTRNQFFNFGGQYSTRHINCALDFGILGENFYADMGFENFTSNLDAARDTIIRLGSRYAYNDVAYNWFPQNRSPFNQISLRMESFYQQTLDGRPYERSNEPLFTLAWKSTAALQLLADVRTSWLRFPFSFTSDAPLPAGTYHYARYGIAYNTDLRRDFSVQMLARTGRFYSAGFRQARLVMNVRKQPRFNIALTAEYNLLNFPQPQGREEIVLIAPSFEYNFSTNLFWTTFFQLNTQNNNININSRLQWRFRTMSDLFIVYTDNYFTDPLFGNKNRGLVCRLNYWLNW
jgi:Domain of unknown function (DUF5916)